MKYLLLIHSNPQFQQRWEALTDEQRERFGRDHYALSDELAAATVATLFVLPSVYSLVQQSAGTASASLDPDDPESAYLAPQVQR